MQESHRHRDSTTAPANGAARPGGPGPEMGVSSGVGSCLMRARSAGPADAGPEELAAALLEACRAAPVARPSRRGRWAKLRAAVTRRSDPAASPAPVAPPACLGSVVCTSAPTKCSADAGARLEAAARAVAPELPRPEPATSAPSFCSLHVASGAAPGSFRVRTSCLAEVPRAVSLEDLMSGRSGAARVDNTGNVRVWPAEEALAVLVTRWRGLGMLSTWGGACLLEFGAGRSGELSQRGVLEFASSIVTHSKPRGGCCFEAALAVDAHRPWIPRALVASGARSQA